MPMQDVVLSLLAKEPAHGYELRQRLGAALGPAGGALNPGQVYVTLSRLERAGLVEAREVAQPSHPDKKVYELTAAGRERVVRWLNDLTWAKVAPLEFHLKLVMAATTRLADPVALVDSQLGEPPDSDGALLLEGASLRLQADIRWLEVCQQRFLDREGQRQ
jgi:DNA-binding PadR family transcriptional regulator